MSFHLINDWNITKAYPMIYPWATLGLTKFIEKIYTLERKNIEKGWMVNPVNVELCAILERALNYMHSGNTKVIATSIMNPMWIGRALLHDGLPCLNDVMVKFIPSSWEVLSEHLPYNKATGTPLSAARSVIIYNYDEIVYGVSISQILSAVHSMMIGGLYDPISTHVQIP